MSKRVSLFTRSGFTLLELLAVMSMMALLTTLAVTSYFSAISGMARRSAVKHVVNTLVLARQRACMEGARISVVFFNDPHGFKKDADGNQTTEEDYLPSYVIVKAMGRFSYISGSYLLDEYAELDQTFGTSKKLGISNPDSYQGRLRLYNLTRGGWWMVLPFVKKEGFEDDLSPKGYSETYVIERYGFTVKETQGNASSALAGDVYGTEAGPIGSLPKGFEFDELDPEAEDSTFQVCFRSDGSVDTTVSGSKTAITLIETRLKTNRPKNRITIGTEGSISYSEEWK